MTKAEKQNAKKKRRRERERAVRDEPKDRSDGKEGHVGRSQCTILDGAAVLSGVEFRLFASGPVRPISLLPSNDEYPLPP